MIVLESAYNLGDEVYLKTDEDQKKRIVKQICFSAKGTEYNLVCGTVSTWHSDFEISETKDVCLSTSI